MPKCFSNYREIYIQLIIDDVIQKKEIVKWFPDYNSITLMPRIMKLHVYIDHDSQMTTIDFEVTRSKVKVTVTRNSKMVYG